MTKRMAVNCEQHEVAVYEYSSTFQGGYNYFVCVDKGEMPSLHRTYKEACEAAWALYDKFSKEEIEADMRENIYLEQLYY